MNETNDVNDTPGTTCCQCYDATTGLAKLAEGEGIEPSTFRWRGFQDRVSTLLATLQNLVPPVGFEPTASGLQNHCSTTELQGRKLEILSGPSPGLCGSTHSGQDLHGGPTFTATPLDGAYTQRQTETRCPVGELEKPPHF